MAHAAARALTIHAPATDRPTRLEVKDHMTDYNDIRNAYRIARRTFPFPHPQLGRVKAVLLRQLQTRSLPSPALLDRIYPEAYQTDKCKACRRETADHMHIFWDCMKHPEEARSRTITSPLEVAAKNYDQQKQLWAIQQVIGVIEGQGPSEPATASGDQRQVTAKARTT
ncbi:hypothetical protein HPB51_015627 [Rhipicephalus microplus]|uniref:Tick transposon n=1 Tax=Rhipicephalus microplus TaxID=6941 RepID=A0A9J6EH05_RHIMP|nr:hypothetical protein HPB51_015627 [Rhipicephalus microplus]